MVTNSQRIAERSLITLLLKNDRLMPELCELGITADHFSDVDLRKIFVAAKKLYEENGSFAVPSVVGALDDDRVNLVIAIESEKVMSSVGYYADVVMKAHVRAKALAAVAGLYNQVTSLDPTVDYDYAAAVSQALDEITKADTGKSRSVTSAVALAELEEDIKLRLSGSFGTTTGVKRLDSILNGGLCKDQFYIIGARPGDGKTTFALQIAINAASQGKVGFITVEMSPGDLMANIVANLSGVDNQRIRNDKTAPHTEQVDEAKRIAAELPLMIYDCKGADFAQVQIEIGKMVKSGVTAIFVDYLQILRDSGHRTRLEELNHISNSLKRIARENRIPVVACAQLRRETEHRNDGFRLSDIKDSGSIEQDADVVIFINRATREGAISAVDLDVAKNRRGRIGVVAASANYATGRFIEAESR